MPLPKILHTTTSCKGAQSFNAQQYIIIHTNLCDQTSTKEREGTDLCTPIHKPSYKISIITRVHNLWGEKYIFISVNLNIHIH